MNYVTKGAHTGGRGRPRQETGRNTGGGPRVEVSAPEAEDET